MLTGNLSVPKRTSSHNVLFWAMNLEWRYCSTASWRDFGCPVSTFAWREAEQSLNFRCVAEEARIGFRRMANPDITMIWLTLTSEFAGIQAQVAQGSMVHPFDT